MRAYSWSLFAGLALACGGSAFTSNTDGGDGSSGSGDTGNVGNDGATAGVLSRAGRSGVGGKTSKGGGSSAGSDSTAGTDTGGTTSSGGTDTTGGVVGSAGDLGIAGDLVAGGSVSAAGNDGVAGTSADPPPDNTCPASEPMTGRACVGDLSCTFGTDVRTWCRPRATCQKGAWSVAASTCKAIHSCQGEVTAGATCDPSIAAECIKSGTQYCQCAMCQGNACNVKPIWSCASAGTGSVACPKLAPNDGQDCTAKPECSYGTCGIGQAINASCVDGFWDWKSQVCPF